MVEQRPLKPFVAGSIPAQLIKSLKMKGERSLSRFYEVNSGNPRPAHKIRLKWMGREVYPQKEMIC